MRFKSEFDMKRIISNGLTIRVKTDKDMQNPDTCLETDQISESVQQWYIDVEFRRYEYFRAYVYQDWKVLL